MPAMMVARLVCIMSRLLWHRGQNRVRLLKIAMGCAHSLLDANWIRIEVGLDQCTHRGPARPIFCSCSGFALGVLTVVLVAVLGICHSEMREDVHLPRREDRGVTLYYPARPMSRK